MRRLLIVLVVIGVVIATFVCAVLLRLATQRQEMAVRGPLTVEEIAGLAAEWGVAKNTRPVAPEAKQEESSASGLAQPDLSPAAPAHTQKPSTGDPGLPAQGNSAATAAVLSSRPHLKRTLTPSEKQALANDYRQFSKRLFGGLMTPLMEFATTAGLCVGLSREGAGIHYYEAAGNAYYQTGDWETARRLYRQALDCPLEEEVRQRACLRLAWLEDDPQVADRLLELACPVDGTSPNFLSEAAGLACRVGDQDSFDYYVARLQELDPQWAEEMRSYHRTSEDDRNHK